MPKVATYFLLTFVLVIILLVVFIYIVPYLFEMIAGAQKRVSPTVENTTEVVNGTFRSLGIAEGDTPDIIVYKLFRNFDTKFVNEKSGNQIKYNSFILDLGTHTYGYGDTLKNNLTQGVKDFSKIDSFYQIGNVLPSNLNCNTQVDLTLDYNANDCWNQATFNGLSVPCLILLHGNAFSRFDGKLKIRVGWVDTSLKADQREIVNVLIALCDG